MENRIGGIDIHCFRLDPVAAELELQVGVEQLTLATEVRGRLMGPRCRYASTVEVAYPLREIWRSTHKDGSHGVTLRAVVPEPSHWDPQSPFLYEVRIELWQEGQWCDRKQFCYGLRNLALGRRGILWNGRPLGIRGVSGKHRQEDELRRLRQNGFNTLLASVGSDTKTLWETADRLGFLMLGKVEAADTYEEALNLMGRACCLGWVLGRTVSRDNAITISNSHNPTYGLLGLELNQMSGIQLPSGIQFIFCTEASGPALVNIGLPKLVVRSESSSPPIGQESPPPPSLLGYVYS
jgi:hypothetical protein